MIDGRDGSRVVAAFGMTHTPGLGDRLDAPPADQIERIMKGFAEGRRLLADARPDMIIGLVNDHFDLYTLNNMPAFSICVADDHYGPPPDSEAWIQLQRRRIAGSADYAMDLYKDAIKSGFDLTRSGSAEFVHNMLIPLRYLRPEMDIPVVPIFTNCFAPPLPSVGRAHALGERLRETIERRPERVALVASGGLSHWPPYPREWLPPRDELDEMMLEVFRDGAEARARNPAIRSLIHEREAEMAAEDRQLINTDWDRSVLSAFEKGDSAHILGMTFDDIEEDAGIGGHEILLWAMLMGAMGRNAGRTILYEPVKEWMGGVALFAYE